jgi:hypothetical protein
VQKTRIKRNERLIIASYELLKDSWADESTLGVSRIAGLKKRWILGASENIPFSVSWQ